MIGLIRDHLLQRLEANEIEVLKSAGVVLNSECWDEVQFVENDIRRLVHQFETPLRNVTSTNEEILDEW